MSQWLKHRVIQALSTGVIAAAFTPASADTLRVVHRFTDTGQGTPSHYALGNAPYAELVQASDGNFYGTTVYGGSGLCPNTGQGGYTSCGTVFRMTPQGKVTALYSFPYDPATSTAVNGAFPTAGLIQGKDGFLYGVAQDGGLRGCNGTLGCGTLFRISLAGAFKLLHQFCNGDGCTNPTEGGRAMGHLVQLADGSLCGTAAEGGIGYGTLFCASTAGAVSTQFVFDNTNYGNDPTSALLVGADGKTLYGTTAFGGPSGQGTVFAYAGGQVTILHAFDFNAGDMSGNPECTLIFGADGRLYGTTYGGNPAGVIFALRTDGTGYTSQPVFDPQATSGGGLQSASGLLLASNGLMYGTTLAGGADGGDGSAYSYDPAKHAYKTIASFDTNTGAAPRAVLVEGADRYLYGTASLYGGSNARGGDGGSIVRLIPALKSQ